MHMTLFMKEFDATA